MTQTLLLAQQDSADLVQSVFRNRLTNGGFRIDQRNAGAAQTYTAGAALLYGIDRWYGYCSGANVTGQQIAVNGRRRYQFTGAASVTAVGLGQRIEAANCADMAGQNAVLQVKLSSSSLTAVTWTAYYANTADTFGTLASPTRTQIATGTFTITATEATYSAPIAVPAAATTGIEIVFSAGALLAAQTLTIGDAQLELGVVPTSPEVRPIATELSLCQRYFEAGDFYTVTASTATSSAYPAIVFKVVKRTNPSVAISSLVYSQTSNATLYSNSAHRFTIIATVTSSGVATSVAGNYTADAEL